MSRIHFRAWIVAIVVVGLSWGVAACQELAGKWVFPGEKLHNGEQQRTILDLNQKGAEITGQIIALGWANGVKGTIHDSHFELFRTDVEEPKPFLVGDVANGELRITFWGGTHVGHKASAQDDIVIPAQIAPPALHPVASIGQAKTPPMGWNSWNLFADKIDDKTVREMADAMVTSGLRDAGYVYLNIDDTWEGLRDEKGVLHTNSKFPDMKALADYVHSKGLKIGIYSSPGPRTCGGYPASYGFEEQDAKMFAAWGFDFLKYDWCSAGYVYKDEAIHAVYQKMGDALLATGRPIVYSLCEYGLQKVETWGPEVGANLWRTTDDIRDEWESMMTNIHVQAPTAPWAGPGRWNDPDMLEVGNGHMTADEYRTHITLWALTAAPLLAGNDVRTMTAETKSILLNKEVIAVDQDALGKQAVPVKVGQLERWVKPLADGGVAIGIVNLGAAPAVGNVEIKDLPIQGSAKQVRDLWTHQIVALQNGAYSATIPAHGTLLLRISAK